MAYVRYKIINGHGPYPYLQESYREGDKVHTRHIRYLGTTPGSSVTYQGQRIPVPPPPADLGTTSTPPSSDSTEPAPTQLTTHDKPVSMAASTEQRGAAMQATMARLQGSEKQVAWAEDIRAEKLAEIEQELRMARAQANRPEAPEFWSRKAVRAVRALQRLAQQADARYWITTARNLPVSMIIDREGKEA